MKVVRNVVLACAVTATVSGCVCEKETCHTVKHRGERSTVIKSATLTTVWTGTQKEFDAISEPSPTTLYIIKE